MKKKFVFLILYYFCFSMYSQIDDYPDFLGKDLNTIEINSDWKILKKASGFLNNNSIYDVSLILESKDSILKKRCTNCKILKSKPRIILVIVDNRVIIQNNKFIALGDEGGMTPYLEPKLSIENNNLNILYQYTRGIQSYTFELKRRKMYLIHAKNSYVHAGSGDFESYEFNFKKRFIITETGNISNKDYIKEKKNISKTLKCLSELGEIYDWEVIEGIYL